MRYLDLLSYIVNIITNSIYTSSRMTKLIKNVQVVTPNGIFCQNLVVNREGRIEKLIPSTETSFQDGEQIDGKGCYAFPGMVDVLTHGYGPYLYIDAEKNAILENSLTLAKHGVTAFAPSLTSLPLSQHLETLEKLSKTLKSQGARILGIHSEGPCFGAAGAHNPDNLILPSEELAHQLLERANGNLKFITLAPELEGSEIFIKIMNENKVSVHFGHSNATPELIPRLVDMGVHAVTHMYNVMKPAEIESPGVYPLSTADALIAEKDLCLGLICDGVHTSEGQVKLLAQLSKDRVFLETDSMKYTGLPPGEFELFPGAMVKTTRGKGAWLDEGLAGSTVTSDDALRNFIEFGGVDLVHASYAASLNPARLAGMEKDLGSLEVGKYADIVLLHPQSLGVMATYVSGKEIFLHQNF